MSESRAPGWPSASERPSGSNCLERTFLVPDVYGALWVGIRHNSDRAASGGFAPLLKNSCRSANDPKAAIISISISIQISVVLTMFLPPFGHCLPFR
jgi:hypothetical protein